MAISRREGDRARTPKMGPLVLQASAAVVAALVGAVALYLLLAWLLGVAPRPETASSDQQKLLADMVKIALGLAAGVGAAVALIVGYRRARVEEAASHRDDQRLFSSRYQDAAELIGDDKAAVRLAGVYAMSRLADDWDEQRQQCVDVLCAYLRLPYDPEKNEPGEQEVRLTVIRIITEHLRPEAPQSKRWGECRLDFTGAVFDGGDFSGAEFSAAAVSFRGAKFSGGTGTIDFRGAKFSGSAVDFHGAEFSGDRFEPMQLDDDEEFPRSTVDFSGSKFTGGAVAFRHAKFTGGIVDFSHAEFSLGTVNFSGAEFSGSKVDFAGSKFTDGTVDFGWAKVSDGFVDFSATFSGGIVWFGATKFTGGIVDFGGTFLSGTVDFRSAEISGTVDFTGAEFTGGTVDLSEIVAEIGWPQGLPDPPPAGLMMPGSKHIPNWARN